MKVSRSMKVAAAFVAVSALAAQSAVAAVSITAGGSSFAAPLLNACKVAWQTSTGNTLTYTTSSSGTGQTNENNGIGDFNFSDSAYTATKATIIHIPVVAAPIAVGYNLPGKNDLYLTQKTLSDIFAGKVTKWNDPEIAADNNGATTKIIFKKDGAGNPVKDASGKPVVLNTVSVKRYYTLPDQAIRIVARADASGTTANFVKLFNKQFPTLWSKANDKTFTNDFPGNVNDPANLGRIQTATGSAGVAATMSKTPYSIGYFEASYATGKLRNALVGNTNGDFAAPDTASTSAFLGSATATADGKLTFDYNTKTPGAYVLGIVSYALVDTAATGENAKAAKSFLQYVLSPACPTSAPTLGYATITGSLLTLDNTLLASLKA
jgi:phosphate transport system substrate-binding protein